jgi:endonuclease YncB( thermonuclease family)
MDTPEGRQAKAFTTKRLLAAKTVVVKTIRVDLHGRYVAHLIYSDRDVSIDTCFTEGTHLNNELVVDGYAEMVTG